MDNDQLLKDLELAKKLCHELRSGNRNVMDELIQKYDDKFKKIAEWKLYKRDLSSDLMSDYWIKLQDGKAICNYEGKNNSSFKNYLYSILIYLIIDYNRKKQNDKEEQLNSTDIQINGNHPEKRFLAMEKQKIINESILIMSKTFPDDASLVKMYLNGKNYKEMAKILLKNQKFKNDLIEKKSVAIRKQFKRKKTGSLERFKKIVERLLKKNGLTSSDMFV